MANLDKNIIWELEIYKLAVTDDVLGGDLPAGISNQQAQQLANRTLYLYTELNKAKEKLRTIHPIGEVQMLAAPAYNAADYDTTTGSPTLGRGTAGTPAEGWALCNGNNGTADLRGQFVVGMDPDAADYATPGLQGGNKAVTLTNGQMPRHNHKGGNTQAYFAKVNGKGTINADTDDSITEINLFGGIAIQDEGNNEAHENRPPFYTLVLRQRISN